MRCRARFRFVIAGTHGIDSPNQLDEISQRTLK